MHFTSRLLSKYRFRILMKILTHLTKHSLTILKAIEKEVRRNPIHKKEPNNPVHNYKFSDTENKEDY